MNLSRSWAHTLCAAGTKDEAQRRGTKEEAQKRGTKNRVQVDKVEILESGFALFANNGINVGQFTTYHLQ